MRPTVEKDGLSPKGKRGKAITLQKTVENSAQSYTYYSTDSTKQQVFHIQFFHFSTLPKKPMRKQIMVKDFILIVFNASCIQDHSV